MSLRKVAAWTAIAVLTAGFAWYVSQRPMDFRVYHYGARGVFDGTRPVYGPTSGLGWPMHYRYPPLFLLLFAPLAELPLSSAAAVWLVLKVAVLILLLHAFSKRLPVSSGVSTWVVPLLLAGPFVIQDFRYGNAQFFVFALTAAGLLLARERILVSAGMLALGIAIKIWPLFFIPYLLVRRETKLVAWTLILTLGLTLIPSIHFGFEGNLKLIGEWFQQEFATQTGQEEIWFPSQSLRGVLMRYLTFVDYSVVPDSSYPQVQVADWSPELVRTIWLCSAASLYLYFLWLTYTRRKPEDHLEVALAFCLIGLLQPFTQKYALVILLWPAIVASRLINQSQVRALIWMTIGLVLIQPVIPGSAAQRWMQVLGLDFAATSTLALALLRALYNSRAVVTNFSSLRHESFNLK